MALIIDYARYLIQVLYALLSCMVEDWRSTAWTIQHVWMTIRLAGRWRTILGAAVVVTLVSVSGKRGDISYNKSDVHTICRRGGHANLDRVGGASAAWIWKHLYLDGTGLPDYAAGRAGARIVHDLTSPTYGETSHPSTWAWSWRQPPRPGLPSFPPPESAISSDTQPGSCWPMAGNHGTLGIALARPVAIASFTIDHIPRSIAINPGTAPRSGELWGVLAKDAWFTDTLTKVSSELIILNSSAVVRQFRLPDNLEPLYRDYDFVRLGSFAYDLDYYLPFQTFHLPVETSIALGDTAFDVVLLTVSDNWGDQDFTCLYRVRVHPK